MSVLLDEMGWALKREIDTINMVRKEFGLEPIFYKEMVCKRIKQVKLNQYTKCDRTYEAQFVGSRRIEHYCPKCRYDLAEIDRSTF